MKLNIKSADKRSMACVTDNGGGLLRGNQPGDLQPGIRRRTTFRYSHVFQGLVDWRLYVGDPY